MPTNIVIPSAGESVTSGVVSRWLKADGEVVKRDEVVLEVETDKVTLEVPAPASGSLKRMVAEGATVKIGEIVGSVDEAAVGAPKAALEPAPAPAKKADAKPAAAAAPPVEVKSVAPAAAPTPTAAPVAVAQSGNGHAADVRATPLARKLADEKGIDLSQVRGTGAGGRIREEDVLAFLHSSTPLARPDARNTAPSLPSPSTREKMTPLRQRIAQRLVQAQHTAAMLTTFNECDMGAVMDLRKQYKEEFEKKHGIGLGFMGFFVKATAAALQSFPLVNASIVEDPQHGPMIEKHNTVDIAVAVSTPKGLVVPVLRGCQSLSVAQVESGIKDLAVRARDGKLTLEDMQGGTFTITNGGVFGSLMSTPILNPPQSAILGMHAIKNRPAEWPVGSGQIALRPMMYLALSYDHRIIDGAEAVQFLVKIKQAIEDPQRLLLAL